MQLISKDDKFITTDYLQQCAENYLNCVNSSLAACAWKQSGRAKNTGECCGAIR
ncbi:hypothetical protein J4733_07245 [Klebsiella pneumoniae]|uniref:Uncharacterized protein n=1 Tax=Klebsiella pneumoniae TaxID=573 RepID=A0A939SRR0_KLEPN|nr:hypothetical protein [Klebsiella pneumoniae]